MQSDGKQTRTYKRELRIKNELQRTTNENNRTKAATNLGSDSWRSFGIVRLDPIITGNAKNLS